MHSTNRADEAASFTPRMSSMTRKSAARSIGRTGSQRRCWASIVREFTQCRRRTLIAVVIRLSDARRLAASSAKSEKCNVPSESIVVQPTGGRSAKGSTLLLMASSPSVMSSRTRVEIRDHGPSSGPKHCDLPSGLSSSGSECTWSGAPFGAFTTLPTRTMSGATSPGDSRHSAPDARAHRPN